jgi:dTDP-4-amino-4,6-dideoxygalactose transaminase
VDYDRVGRLGINAKLSEPAAAMGLVSLASLDSFIEVNRRNFTVYQRALADIPGLTIAPIPQAGASNFHYVTVQVDPDSCGTSRDVLLSVLHAENVLARRYFYPGCHRMEPYASLPAYRGLELPFTDQAAARILALPTGTAVGEDEIEIIGSILRVALKNGREISRRTTPTGR